MSTLSSNLATLVSGRSLHASSRPYRLVRSTFADAFLNLFPCWGMFRFLLGGHHEDALPPDLLFDFDAHRSRGSGDRAHCSLEVGGVEVGQLHGGDVFELLLGDLPNLDLVRLLGAGAWLFLG